MKTTTRQPDAFGSILSALAAVYEAEIVRLAEHYRLRILAGEFSGRAGDDLGHMRLERELEKDHPWTTDVRAGRAVLTVSAWAYSESNSLGGGVSIELEGRGLTSEVAECMAHDVLAVAAARGWVKRYRERDDAPYAPRVA